MRYVFRWMLLGVGVMFSFAAASSVAAQDAPVTAEDLRAIHSRLAEADAKIESLQAQLREDDSVEGGGDASVAGQQPALIELKKEVDGLHFVVPGSSGASVVFNGRIHGDAWFFPGADTGTDELEGENPQDRLGFRRIRFGAKGDVSEAMSYKVEMEFANPDDTEFRDVYIGFKKLPYVQTLLVGNQKRPYGLDHLNSSRYNVFLERPMFIDAFNDDARRLGVVGYGLSEDQAWNWRYGVYNGDKIQDSDALYQSDHLQGEFAARIANTAWYENEGSDYYHWALSGTVAFPDGDGDPVDNTARFRARPEARSDDRWINTDFIDGADTYELVGVEQVLNLGPVQAVGELQNTFLQRKGGGDLHFWGAYAYLSYFLTGEHMPWSRKSGTLGRIKPKKNFFLGGDADARGWGAWQVALRYSYSDMSDDDVDGGIGQNLACGLNWYFNPNSRLQLNYIHGWINDSTTLDAIGRERAEYDIVGARFMVDF